MNSNKYNANVTNLLKEHIESLERFEQTWGLQFAGKSKLITFKQILKNAKTKRTYN